jgi:hypothetical protein
MKNTYRILLRLMLRHSHIMENGLCELINKMFLLYYISNEERILLKNYLKENIPDISKKGIYWWPRGEKEPRIKWLHEELNKLYES